MKKRICLTIFAIIGISFIALFICLFFFANEWFAFPALPITAYVLFVGWLIEKAYGAGGRNGKPSSS